jgi:hypothetical protein
LKLRPFLCLILDKKKKKFPAADDDDDDEVEEEEAQTSLANKDVFGEQRLGSIFGKRDPLTRWAFGALRLGFQISRNAA